MPAIPRVYLLLYREGIAALGLNLNSRRVLLGWHLRTLGRVVNESWWPSTSSMALHHVGKYTYEQRDTLGRGSFADVFKGTDPAGNIVAVKRIHQNRLKKESSLKLLKSEVSIMQIAKHPNIVRLLEHIDTDDHVCLVMEVGAWCLVLGACCLPLLPPSPA